MFPRTELQCLSSQVFPLAILIKFLLKSWAYLSFATHQKVWTWSHPFDRSPYWYLKSLSHQWVLSTPWTFYPTAAYSLLFGEMVDPQQTRQFHPILGHLDHWNREVEDFEPTTVGFDPTSILKLLLVLLEFKGLSLRSRFFIPLIVSHFARLVA